MQAHLYLQFVSKLDKTTENPAYAHSRSLSFETGLFGTAQERDDVYKRQLTLSDGGGNALKTFLWLGEGRELKSRTESAGTDDTERQRKC